MKANKILPIVLISIFAILFASCGTSSNKTCYARLIYEGQKEITLYYNPNIAEVDGQSGNWQRTGIADVDIEIHYGSRTCCVSTCKGLIYWGDLDEAIDNLYNESNWTMYRLKH